MPVWAKRVAVGMGVLLMLLAAAFLSMVRITVQSAAPAAPPVAPVSAPVAPAGAPAAVQTRVQTGDAPPLVIPVEGIQANQLRDSWGEDRGGGARAHHAIDILAPRGTLVLAAASGKVEKLFESVNGGHTIYIRTQDGATIHYYAHLDTYLVSSGQLVRQGDPIATVGDTGSAAGGAPHLHFEIKVMQPGEGWWQGQNINPYPLLRDARR